MSFFDRHARAGRATSRPQQTTEPVDVTARQRQHGVTAAPTVHPLDRPLDPDLTGCDVEHIRQHLPNAAVPSANLRACRVAAVLDKQADFLADRTGTVEPPDRQEFIDACRSAAEQLRDGVVIGSRA